MFLFRIILLGFLCTYSFVLIAQDIESSSLHLVKNFKGQQVTGIAINNEDGRMFANFPRWNDDIEASVVEILPDGSHIPYPNKDWNGLEIKKSDFYEPMIELDKSHLFVAVQSLYVFENKLYVLDTRNAFWQGLEDAPRIFVFDLFTNILEDILIFEEGSFAFNSYANDLRIDKENQIIIITDSNEAALIIYDLQTRKSKRVLHKHFSTIAEKDHLLIEGNKWINTVHADGIAFDEKNKKVYFHALTGHNLYAIESKYLKSEDLKFIENQVQLVAHTAAPDGMIFDEKGNLFFADLEHFAIMYRTPEGEIKMLYRAEEVGWADSFAIHKGYLYFSNSKIHEEGEAIEKEYPIYKINISHL